jgi:hypothetical protein
MRKNTRRGLGVTEWLVVAVLLAVVILASVSFLGTATEQRINNDVNGPNGILGRQAEAAKQ